MGKHDYHDPYHGLRETYHDLAIAELERRFDGRECPVCGAKFGEAEPGTMPCERPGCPV